MSGLGLRAMPASEELPSVPEPPRLSRFARGAIADRFSLSGSADRLARLFPRCGHPRCSSGRMRLWRNAHAPVFEGRWACSPACLRAIVEAGVTREGGQRRESDGESMPRMPLGLMLLEQGQLSEQQLREALEGRRRAAETSGEAIGLEDWLLSSGLLSEAALTRAVSAQWNCPVFVLSGGGSEAAASTLPRFLAEAMGVLPVRIAGGKLVCLAFSGRIDRSLSYAVEHMTGMRVSAGIARESEFRREEARFLSAPSPKTRFLEAEDRPSLAKGIAAWIEEEQPIEARLARVHEIWWLRIWRRAPRGGSHPAGDEVEDLLATVGPGNQTPGDLHSWKLQFSR